MESLSHAQLVGFRTKYEAMFNQAFQLAEPQIEKCALKFDSGRVEIVNHRWMKGIPTMREFIGSRIVNPVDTNGFTITNKEWEDTISIPRRDIERDQWGVFAPMTTKLGQTAKLHRDVLGFGVLSAALASGTRANYTAYDGIAFFGAHTGRKVPFTNYIDGASSNLSAATLEVAIAALRNRRDYTGNVLAAARSKPLLIVPPALGFVARKLQNLSFYVGTAPGASATQSTSNYGAATENILQGTFDVEEVPYLATDTEWYVTLVDPIFRPLVFQVEQEVQFQGYEQFLEAWNMRSEFVLGARALYNVAVGLPEMIYGSVGA